MTKGHRNNRDKDKHKRIDNYGTRTKQIIFNPTVIGRTIERRIPFATYAIFFIKVSVSVLMILDM